MGTTRTNLLDRLERHATWKNAALAVVGIALTNLAMAAYIFPDLQARRPEVMRDGFPVMIDLQPLSSPDEVYRILALYEPDILGLVQLLYALDFVIPLTFAVFALCLFGKMLRYLDVTSRWRALLLLPFAALPFDYAENALSLFLLARLQDGQVFPALARAASTATAAKFVALAGIGAAAAALLLCTATALLVRRTDAPRRP